MGTGAFNRGRFAGKQGRSPPLWSIARTGFILAVCTPLAIAPVPAAAEDYYPPPHPSGGSGGFGGGAGIGAGIVGGLILGTVLQHLNENNPPYRRPRPPPPPYRRPLIVTGPR
jgi:hypothetical protein